MLAEPLVAASEGMGSTAPPLPAAAAAPFSAPPAALAETAGAEVVIAWLLLVTIVLLAAAAVPWAAAGLRRGLPGARREPIPLEPVAFGDSPFARRSPRHAVRLHRTVVTSGFVAVLSLVVLTGIAALRTLGAPGLQVAVALVLPVLLVALHARQRSRAS